MRRFDTGATRDDEQGKLDFDGFLSPLVLRAFAEYMNTHRMQADGELRTADNWQKGIPSNEYMKSAFRHFMDWWLLHRGYPGVATQDIKKAICALIFNAQGYLHEHLRECARIEYETGAASPAGETKGPDNHSFWEDGFDAVNGRSRSGRAGGST